MRCGGPVTLSAITASVHAGTRNTFARHLSCANTWEKTKCLHPVPLTPTAWGAPTMFWFFFGWDEAVGSDCFAAEAGPLPRPMPARPGRRGGPNGVCVEREGVAISLAVGVTFARYRYPSCVCFWRVFCLPAAWGFGLGTFFSGHLSFPFLFSLFFLSLPLFSFPLFFLLSTPFLSVNSNVS